MKILSFIFSLTLFLLGVISTSLQAQGCDCPASTNLLSNPDFGLGDTGFTSDLPMFLGCSVNTYAVGNEPTAKCGAGGWINDLWDNTFGTSAGRYLIVDGPTNAVTSAPNRIWAQNVWVTAGQTYSFSFFVLPQVSTSPSNLNLAYYVNGINISGDLVIPSGTTWLETDCFEWTAPYTGNADLDIRQVNNFAYGGYDYGIDDVYFGICPQTEPCQVEANWNYYINPQDCSINIYDLSVAGPGTTIVGYYWDFGDGNTSTEMEPSHIYEGMGEYEVCLTVYAVNEDGECCTSKICRTIQIECEPEPCAANIIDIYPGLIAGGGGCDLFFDVAATANRPIVGYFWNFGDGNTGTGTSPSHSYATSGMYTVCVTIVLQDGDDCCSDTFCKEIPVHCFGAQNNRIDNGQQTNQMAEEKFQTANIRIFPNPSSDETALQFESELVQDYQINIFNLDGKLMNQLQGQTVKGTNKERINTETLEAGTYIIRVALNNEIYSEKLMVF